ncbi:MAG: ABC transporter permease, partial [Candidatus Omnitrophica bacterium]|nr:ABC transporter permease [Candidatus Omnitrophota bacterium]
IMIVFVYVAVFRVPVLLGCLYAFVFSFLILSAYWLQSFFISCLFVFMVTWLHKKRVSFFLRTMFFLGFLTLLFILFPLISLMSGTDVQTVVSAFNPELRSALSMSVFTAGVSTCLICFFGIPFAYCMARMDFKGKPAVDALIDVPILVPQTAVGIAMLTFLGPKTPAGEFISQHFGVGFSGSTLGIIACQVFVSMPFLIRSSISAFEGVNPRLELVSRTLGANSLHTFLKISLPLALPGIFNGCILSFSRALSEAGSLIIVAYRPATIPTYINDVFAQYGIKESVPVGVVFIGICLWGFIVLKWLYEIRKKSLLRV